MATSLRIRRWLVVLGAAGVSAPIAAVPAGAQSILSAAGVRFVHEEWTAATGLPITQLTGMLQSRDGYLWFTTFDGLVRFDGVRFTVFNSGNTPDLPTNRLTALREDGAGRIWIRSEQGHLIEQRDGTFIDHTPSLSGGRVLGLHADPGPGGGVWAGTPAGVYRIVDTASVPVHAEAIREPVPVVLVDSREVLWVGTALGVLYRVADRGDGEPVRVDGLDGEEIRRLAEGSEGDLWIDGGGRAFRLGEAGLERLPPYPPDAGPAVALHPPSDGRAPWIQTWSGPLALVDGAWTVPEVGPDGRLAPLVGLVGPNGGIWTLGSDVVFYNGEELLRTPRRVERLLFDREGTIWISGAGLHRLRPAVIEQRGANAGLVDNVYTIHEDRRGRIWLGSLGGGLIRIDDDGVYRYPADAASGLSNVALAVHEDRIGDVWVGLADGGVCRLAGRGCAPDRIERLGGRLVRGIHEDRTGALWFGTEDGVFRRDPAGGLLHLTPGDGLPHPDVRTFAEDRRGRIWMGTYGGGVAVWDGDRLHAIGPEDGLSSGVIRSIYMDPEGVLWVGTEGRGLNRVVIRGTGGAATERVTVYRASHGLFDEGLHAILEDRFGRLWMSTNRGIFWVSKEELTAFAEGRLPLVHSTVYTERDGLLNREMNGGVHGAGIADGRGHLWFAGMAGAARMDPSAIHRNEVAPPVAIEEVTAGGRTQPISGAHISLAADRRDFEISYTALSFVAPENNRFRYRLVGFDDDWVDAGGRRTAFYTNVPPGEYTFTVVASNNDGVWNEEGASLTLSVARHFHETWPARGALLLLLAVLGFVGLRHRERSHRLRAAELEALVRARTRTIESQARRLAELDAAKSRFFANISHELRTPLTLTIGPLEDVREGAHGPIPEGAAEDVDLALKSARRLLRLVNQILDVARLEAGELKLRAARADLVALLERLVAAFTPLAERKRISLGLAAEGALPVLYLDPDLMEKVFTNLLSNALKFTPADGTVRVSVDRVTTGPGGVDGVRVSVRDSGPGIPPAERPHLFERFYRGHASRSHATPGTGIGLSLVKELVELHGGSIEVHSEEGFGSVFSVVLRTGKDHLPADAVVDEARDEVVRAPSAATDADWATSEEEPAGAVPGAGGDGDAPVVMVVDDNANVRAFVRRHLAPRYHVVEAASGTEALERAGERTPDLVVTDLMMPGMDGLELVRRLRTDARLDTVPVVLLTARAELADQVRGLDAGADDYLTKPFAPAELVARVERLIRSHRRLRDRRPVVHLHASDVEVESRDERFLHQLRSVVEEHIADEDFDVEALARAMAHSRSALYRRLAELNAGSPADVIRAIRLERAAQLLAARAGSVSRVAHAVGFKSVSHFSRSFREHHGVNPSGYRDRGVPAD